MAHVHRSRSEPELGAEDSKRRYGLDLSGTVGMILGSSKSKHSSRSRRVQRGQPSVVVGPVIGKVTHNSARVLLEINKNAVVTAVLEPEKPDLLQKKKKWSTSLSSAFVIHWRSQQNGSKQLLKKKGEVDFVEVTDPEEEMDESVSMEKQLKAGRPSVFHFTNLQHSTRYKLHLKGCCATSNVSGSFKTLGIAAPSSGTQCLNFAVISCNNVYSTQTAIPIRSDLWEQLYKNINAGKVDYLLHLGDQIYADVHSIDEAPELNRFEMAKLMLRNVPPEEWKHHKERICELYRETYRDTWRHPPTAKCLANCPSLMILDDHEIRDNWGDVSEDRDRNSMNFFVARCAWRVYLEYQRQLHEDVDFSNLATINKEYHFHLLGGVGLIFADIRGSRTFHRVEPGDKNAYLGSQQWKDICDSLASPGGFFNGATVLLLCGTAPLVFLEPTITNVAAKRVNRLEDFKGHWSAAPHTEEQIRMIDSLVNWKGAQADREVLVLGGDVHCGGHSVVFKDNEAVFHQLTSSAIANTPLPKTAYYFMRLVGRLGGSLRTGYTFKHFHWTRSRNYGLVHVKIHRSTQSNPSVEISTQLVKGKLMRGILLGPKVLVSAKMTRKKKPFARGCLPVHFDG